MKSSIKIDYERSHEAIPVIKIIVPTISSHFDVGEGEDVRDKLIRDFLHSPLKAERNYLFGLSSCYSSADNTCEITAISPIKYEDILYRLRHIVLNRLVSEEDVTQFNQKLSEPSKEYKKVHEFFDWVNKTQQEKYEKEPVTLK